MNAEDVLLPGGEPIGAPSQGGDERIRDVPGGAAAAADIFDQLARGGAPYRGDYPGTAVELPNGGFVGIRDADTNHPTIDVNIPGLRRVSKLHF